MSVSSAISLGEAFPSPPRPLPRAKGCSPFIASLVTDWISTSAPLRLPWACPAAINLSAWLQAMSYLPQHLVLLSLKNPSSKGRTQRSPPHHPFCRLWANFIIRYLLARKKLKSGPSIFFFLHHPVSKSSHALYTRAVHFFASRFPQGKPMSFFSGMSVIPGS
jgi:hypothetical protein